MKPTYFLDSESDNYIDHIQNKKEMFLKNLAQKNYINNQDQQIQSKSFYYHFDNEGSNKSKKIHKNSQTKIHILIAGKKARQKKKKYLKQLQAEVNELQKQLKKYQDQIKKTQNLLNQSLNSTRNNQNLLTYSQLKICIEAEEPNEDQINLLLDLIKCRISAAGKQKQTKIQYFFKQIINVIYPGLYRYLMFCCQKNLDLFQQTNIQEFLQPVQQDVKNQKVFAWTKQLLETVDMSQYQQISVSKFKYLLKDKKDHVKRIIQQLIQLKQRFKQQGQVFENLIQKFRRIFKPFQCASLVLFIEKYKYKKQINLDNQIDTFSQCLQPIMKAKNE